MKKSLILLAILFLFLAISKYCIAKEYKSKNTLEKIEIEVKSCLDKSNGNSDMIQCKEAGIEKYNIEIKQILAKLKGELSKPQYEKLLKSQQQWEKYVADNNILLESTFEKINALDAQLFSINIKYNTIKGRARDLNTILKLYPLYKEDIISEN